MTIKSASSGAQISGTNGRRLRQRGAEGLLRTVNQSTNLIRSKIGSHLSLENSLQMEQSNRTFLKAKKRE